MRMAARCFITVQRRSSAPSTRPAANSTASLVTPSADHSSYPQIPRTRLKNGGRTWRPQGKPHRVNVHDFPSMAEGKAIPYGTYEIGEDRAVVNVGVTHDTAEFAVESIRRWWKLAGRHRKQGAKRILICADAGGSNSSRSRTWKLH